MSSGACVTASKPATSLCLHSHIKEIIWWEARSLAISTPGDIVMDVVRAADPTTVETARARLSTFAGQAADAVFSAVDGALDGLSGRGRASAATPEAFAKFEAMVLQTFLQTMLPKDTESVYGGGMAGEMWQSMLAEKLGDAMASRGGIGIADRVLRDHYYEGESIVPIQGVNHDPAKPEQDRQDLLSTALVQEIQRRMTQSLHEDFVPSSSGDSR